MFSQATHTTSTQLSNASIVRLTQDLKELKNYPLVGANAAPIKNNIGIWHCNILAPESSAYAGTILHFVLEFPENYPVNPPHAYFVTPIKYKGGATLTDTKGRTVVCLDLFGNFKFVHTEWGNDGQASGWSSSYSVSSILVNLQAVLMGDYLSSNSTDIEFTRGKSLELSCKDCGHNPTNENEYFPTIPTQQETNQSMVNINMDPRDRIICYSSKITLSDSNALFGYGIIIDRNGNLSSPCEYLSKAGFDSGIRTSTTNKAFTHWLPLYVSNDHWNKVKNMFKSSVTNIYRMAKKPNCTYEMQIMYVLSSLMNNMVVDVMNSGENATANDKFIDGYFASYRLLTKTLEDYPQLITANNNIIKKFITNENSRVKSVLPNLGQWLITLLASSEYMWENVSAKFIQEVDVRNVFWCVQGTYNSPAPYPELASTSTDPDLNRVEKVFKFSKISRNLVCFQKKFLEYGKTVDVDELDSVYGITPENIKQDLKTTYASISAIKSWNEYFTWNNMSYPGTEVRRDQLINAVVASEKNKYHKSKSNNNNDYNKQKRRYNNY